MDTPNPVNTTGVSSMSETELEGRVRVLEQTVVEFRQRLEHGVAEFEQIDLKLTHIEQLAAQCSIAVDAEKTAEEADRKAQSAHARLDTLKDIITKLTTQHEMCMISTAKDNDTLEKMRSEIMELKLLLNTMSNNLTALTKDKDTATTFISGRVAGLIDSGLKALAIIIFAMYVYMNNNHKQPVQATVHNYPTAIDDDSGLTNAQKQLRKDLDEHKAQDESRFLQQQQLHSKPTPTVIPGGK